jgi:methyl-accepting chemotaxis protein
LSITQKLLISYVLVGVLSTLSISYFYYKSSENALIERTLDQLSSVKNLKKGWIEQYFESQKRDIQFFASQTSIKDIFLKLNNSYKKYHVDSEQYALVDSTLGVLLEKFKLSHRYLNVWFINAEYDVIYTVTHNNYIGLNILKYEGINPAFVEVIHSGMRKVTIADVSYISKDINKPFIIITVPIKEENGKLLGLMLVKIGMNEINAILTQRTGLGKTGESYVVNREMLMRSQSRFIEEKEKIIVNTQATQKAFGGINSREIIDDYRTVKVLSSFVKIDTQGIDWALMSEIDLEEAMQPIYQLRNKMIWINMVICVCIIGITIYLSRFVSEMVQKQNRVKTAALIEGQENERKRISRDLHDGIGQMLTAMKFKVQELNQSNLVAHELKQLIDDTTQEVRRVSVNLMPSVLWDFGLDAALKILFKNTSKEIKYDYYKVAAATELSIEQRICIYRVIQESINNAVKYAECEHIDVKINHQKNEISFSVTDSGRGFDTNEYRKNKKEKGSNGIRNMKERMALLGGDMEINSTIGKSTQIAAILPL